MAPVGFQCGPGHLPGFDTGKETGYTDGKGGVGMMKRIVLGLVVVCLVLTGCERGEAVPSSGGGPVASGVFSEAEKEELPCFS